MQRVKGVEVHKFGVLGKNAPKEIFVDGKWDEKMFDNAVAVVGSRRMTDYGRRVLERMIPVLVGQGRTIVSGFMYGVDMTAHQLSVACGGRTVAVLGWGIEYRMSNEECRMAEEIVKTGGLVISEWDKQEPTRWTFPLRNRIVVALCDEVIVIEAAGKSGALITADMAIKYGKQVWAVPGSITSSVSEGTNKLISEGKAKVWIEDKSQILSTKSQIISKSKIINLIENEGMDVNEIARRLNKPVQEVSAELTMLELAGQVQEREGKCYIPILLRFA